MMRATTSSTSMDSSSATCEAVMRRAGGGEASGIVPLSVGVLQKTMDPSNLWIQGLWTSAAALAAWRHDGAMTIDARPRPRAFWTDARFVLGIVLIIGSIAGVWAVVAAARQTAPVFVAARTIVPGEQVAAGDLEVVEVALGRLDDRYLGPGELEPGAVATRTLDDGELVPRAALGAPGSDSTTTVAIRVADDVPAVVVTGSAVEVWSAPPTDRGTFGPPRILVTDATVRAVSTSDAVMGGGDTSLEIVVARSEVAAVLGAVADGARLSVVPGTAR